LGLRYLVARPGLLALIGFFTVTNFLLGMENVLLPPLVISFAGAAAFGTVAAMGGTGMLVGSLAMSGWGGPKRRVQGVYLYGFMLGGALVLEGLRPNPWLIAAGAFIAAFGTPIANGCVIPILQVKTDPELQGRVFTTMRFVAGLALPIAYLAAGKLADSVFEPLMAPHGLLSSTLGKILGVGHGRGTALLLVVLGFLAILLTIRSLSYRPLSKVESDIPDAVIAERKAS
jgi:DHA3 family macrolide efflux protein-like MFS transporter